MPRSNLEMNKKRFALEVRNPDFYPTLKKVRAEAYKRVKSGHGPYGIMENEKSTESVWVWNWTKIGFIKLIDGKVFYTAMERKNNRTVWKTYHLRKDGSLGTLVGVVA